MCVIVWYVGGFLCRVENLHTLGSPPFLSFSKFLNGFRENSLSCGVRGFKKKVISNEVQE